MIRRLISPKSRLASLIAAAAVVAGVACGEFTGVPASLPVLSDSGTVYALNGAPLGAPTALHAFSGQLTPADADFVFDIAFDLNANGDIVLLPQRAVASGLATTHSVALTTVADTFEAVTSASKDLKFRADTALVVKRNQVVVAQITDGSACSFSLTGTTLFAKLVVRSIDRINRTMTVRYTVDPNCGFRSFASGVPKE
jgi:hypothetical protein